MIATIPSDIMGVSSSLILCCLSGEDEHQQIERRASDEVPPLLNPVSLGIQKASRKRSRYVQILMHIDSLVDMLSKQVKDPVDMQSDSHEDQAPTPLPSLNEPLSPIHEHDLGE